VIAADSEPILIVLPATAQMAVAGVVFFPLSSIKD